MSLWGKLRNGVNREQLHRDVADELAFHLEQKALDYRKQGMSEEESRDKARRQFGNRTLAAEEAVSADLVAWLEGCWRDVRITFRVLRRAPVFAAMAITSLALGIGANTMVFTVMKHVVLDSLPVEKPEQLVILHNPGVEEGHVSGDGMESSFSYPLYQDLAAGTHEIFQGILARMSIGVTVERAHGSERVRCELVSGNYFSLLGVRAWRGRLLRQEDNLKPGGSPVAVLSYGLWERSFGGDEAVIGKTIRINAHSFEIVGIAPSRFYGVRPDTNPGVFVPLMMKPGIISGDKSLTNRLDHWAQLIGRLQPGISVERARAALSVIYPPLRDKDLAFIDSPEKEFLSEFVRNKVVLTQGGRGYAEIRASLADPLQFLMVMVGVVLLITVVNVANLFLSRSAAREREIALRMSVGAGRAALLRQVMTESCVVALIGGGVGVALAYGLTPLVLRLLSSDLTEMSLNARPDGWVLLGTAAVSVVAGIGCGVLPALHFLRTHVAEAMKAEGVTGHTGGRTWVRRTLVGAQLGFSLLLLTAAMLFSASLRNTRNINVGFQPDQVFTFKVDAEQAGYNAVRDVTYGEEVLRKLTHLPGVASAGIATVPVLEGDDRGSNITVPGFTGRSRDDNQTLKNGISEGFFETLRVPLRAGRFFTAADTLADSRAVMVNQAFVKKFLRGNNVVGRQFRFGGGRDNHKPMLTIIGVVANHQHEALRGQVEPFVYYPYATDNDLRALTFYVRGKKSDPHLADAIRSTAQRVDPALAIYDFTSLPELISNNLFAENGLALLSTVFASLAVVLAIVGLYGVVSYSVSRRTREFGIRLAIGARALDVLGIVVRETAVLGAVSLACALPLVFALGHLVRSSLYGVTPNDPWICGGAALLLFVVAVAAGAIPAIAAARIDPHVALRAE